MADQAFITRSRLIQDLRALGVGAGQTVMMHSSVKQMGWIVGGPDVVLDAMLHVLTPTGTLMVMASWEDNPYDFARWPKERQEAYWDECPVYDPKRSRADHREMGILTEYLRTWPGAHRSQHPFSYVAVGQRAEWITENQPWQYRDGPGSPLAKLCEADGWVVLLGSPMGDVTLLHHAEHLANVPNKRIDRYRMPVWVEGKRVWMDFEEYDTSDGIVEWPDNYFETIIKGYLDAGHGKTGHVGFAYAYLFEARHLVDFAVGWMEQHFSSHTT